MERLGSRVCARSTWPCAAWAGATSAHQRGGCWSHIGGPGFRVRAAVRGVGGSNLRQSAGGCCSHALTFD